jgi:cell division protein FtsL
MSYAPAPLSILSLLRYNNEKMQNKQRQLKRLVYHIRYEYVTMNNMVLAIAAVIAISWAWASVQAVQRNYELQREINDKQRQATLVELQADNLQFEQHYYQSTEYLTLEAKRRLGLAEPGERLLVLPPNSAVVEAESAKEDTSTIVTSTAPPPPPLQQWLEFLFGTKAKT